MAENVFTDVRNSHVDYRLYRTLMCQSFRPMFLIAVTKDFGTFLPLHFGFQIEDDATLIQNKTNNVAWVVRITRLVLLI